MEHAGQVLEAWIGKDHPEYKKRLRRWAKRLLQDKVQALIQETRRHCAGTPREAAVEQALGYFERNESRMQYGTFRAAGWFIGSGVVEAGCKTVIGGRCKQSGMFWSKRERKTFWRCAACTAAGGWRFFGKTDSTNTPPATTPCRSPHNGRILSHTRSNFSGKQILLCGAAQSRMRCVPTLGSLAPHLDGSWRADHSRGHVLEAVDPPSAAFARRNCLG